MPSNARTLSLTYSGLIAKAEELDVQRSGLTSDNIALRTKSS